MINEKYSIFPVRFSEDYHEKRKQLKAFAPLTWSVYYKREAPALSDDEEEIITRSAVQAGNIIVARNQESDEIIGYLAYKIRSRQNDQDKTFFDQFEPEVLSTIELPVPLSIESIHRVTEALHVVASEYTFFETHEMVVVEPHRANGISHQLRMEAIKETSSKKIVFTGDIQNPASAAGRLKLGGHTYWAGELFTGKNIPYNLSTDELRVLMHTIAHAFSVEYYPHAVTPASDKARFDSNGILASGQYEKPLEIETYVPRQPATQIDRAVQRLIQRQLSYPHRNFSAIGVTITEL